MMRHTITIHPGEWVADAIGNPDPGALVWFGYKAIALYWKDADAAKIARYHAAGLGVWLIHEWYVEDADGGYRRGFGYGQQARAAADKVGYPADVPMICANDKDTTAALLQTHIDYQRGFADGYGQACGPYADRDVIDALGGLYPINWQCGSPWYSKLWWLGQWVYPNSKWAHFRQYGDKYKLGVDHNECLRECVAWLPNQPDPVEDDDMPTIYKFTDANAVLVTCTAPGVPGVVATWSGRGSDPKVAAWLGSLPALGAREVKCKRADAAGITYVGDPTAIVDSLHKWSAADFRAVIAKV